MEQKTHKSWWEPGVRLFAQLSGWIVAPILIAIYSGQWLDEHFNTEPRYFFICVGVAFVVTNVGLITQTRKALKEMQEESKTKLEKKD